jgi:hypothetical protein
MYQQKKRKVNDLYLNKKRLYVCVCLAQNLIGEMKRMNLNLPARIWIPFYKVPHHIVRIAYTESTVLNSRDRVCTNTLFLRKEDKLSFSI